MYNWPAELVLWMAYLSYLSIQLLYPGMLSCLSSNDTTFLWLFQTFCRHHPLNASIPNGSTHGPLFSDTGHLPSVDWSHSQIPLTCLRRTLLNVFLRLDLFPELYQDVHRWPKLNVLKLEFIFSPDPALPLSLSLSLSGWNATYQRLSPSPQPRLLTLTHLCTQSQSPYPGGHQIQLTESSTHLPLAMPTDGRSHPFHLHTKGIISNWFPSLLASLWPPSSIREPF